MDLKLFEVMEIVLRTYSRQPVQKLIDEYLRLRIILKISPCTFQQLAADVKLPPAESAIFSSKNKQNRGKQIVCLVIDHPLYLSLASKLLARIDQCIIIGEEGQNNNILKMMIEGESFKGTKAVIFKMNSLDLKFLSELLDSYLSVCDVFMGHLHLVVSCYEADSTTSLNAQIEHFQGDQFSDFRENGYFRILQERASRVTLEELCQFCRIQRQYWGELLVFGEGTESLIVWVTRNHLPLLGFVPNFRMPVKKSCFIEVMAQTRLGLKIFTKKEFCKSKLEQLDSTTIIVNLKQQLSQASEKSMNQLFQQQAHQFLKRALFERESCKLNGNIQLCARICQILDIPTACLLKKLMNS